MIFEFQITENDFVDAQRIHLRKVFGTASRAMCLGIALLVLVAAASCLTWLIERPSELVVMLWMLVGMLSFLAFMVFLIVWLGTPYRQQFRKIKALQMPMRMAFADDQITYANPQSEAKVRWAAFEDWRESQNSFLLYLQPRMFYILPKRAIPPEQIDAVRTMLESKIVKG